MFLPAPLEKDVLRQCLDFLALHRQHLWVWRNNNTGVRRTAKGGREFWAFHGEKGAADILGMLLDGSGRIVAIEVKKPGGVLSQDQKAFLERVGRNNGLAFVVDSVVKLEAALKAEGVI